MTSKVIGRGTAIGNLDKRQVVLLPMSKYQTLVRRLQDLEDVLDAHRAVAEYRAGGGKLFTNYVKERRAKCSKSTYNNF